MGNGLGMRKKDANTSTSVQSGRWYTMGDYTVNLLDKLGQGSFGVVYRGKEKPSGKTVAVKEIKIKEGDQGSVAFAEIKNLEKLPNHPNLVQYKCYHFHNDSFWLYMEFCDMGDISEYYRKYYPAKIPLAHQMHFMYQISSSVTHLHSLSTPIIHRDIKPANVLLCKNKHGYPIVKLTDFGTSKVSGEVTNPGSTYMMSTAVGTPMYMAPEFYTGENPTYDKSVDVFAMGMLFLTMIKAEKGKPLLSPKTEGASGGMTQLPIGLRMHMAKEKEEPPLKLVEISSDDELCVQQAKKLIPKMCDVNPKKRPKAAKITDALAQCLDSVKSALSTQVLEGTVTEWPLRSLTGIKLSDIDETDSDSSSEEGAAAESDDSSDNDSDDEASGAVAYLLLQQALKGQMAQKVKKKEEKEQLESIPLIELLRLAAGDSQKEEQDKFEPGELVKIEDDEERVSKLQEGYGGWHPEMRKYLGRAGRVQRKLLHVYKVKFPDGVELSFNPAVIQKLEGSDQLVAGIAHALEEAIHDVRDPLAEKFPRYAVVDITEDAGKMEELQTSGHGGFNKKMILACGIRGIVNKVGDGSVYVECVNGDNWWFNPGVLTIVDTEGKDIEEGDFVVISNIEEWVKRKQNDHGGWVPPMQKTLGQAGIVKNVMKSRHVAKVEVTGGSWTYNLDVLRFVTKGEDLFAAVMKKKLVSMLGV